MTELKTPSINADSLSSEQLITEHLDIWTTAIEQKSSSGRGSSKKFSLHGIKKLRELILELAVRGKLVSQDPNDEPASVLLERIAAEKTQLVKDKKIKKPKALPEISENDKPFELPKGWVWVRLNEVADYNGRPNLDPKNITDNTWLLDLEDIEKDTSKLIYKAVYSERESKSNKSTFKKGDVLYGKLRPYLNKVVIADDDGVCTTEIVPIVPNEAVNAEYLQYLLKSPSFLNYVNSLMYGVKMPRLGTDDAVKSIHPIAPLEEQHRIVAKVDELMGLCDALETQTENSIAAHQTLVEVLLEALLKAPEQGATPEQTAAQFQQSWQRLSEHFDTLFTTTASIDTLKQTILQLAVMGKLVPQNPNDEPANNLIKSIYEIQKKLIKEQGLKTKASIDIPKSDKYIKTPKSWSNMRLGNLAKFIDYRGKTPTKIKDGVRLITAKNVRMGYLSLYPEEFISHEEYQTWMTRGYPKVGDLLFTPEAPLGNVALIDIEEKFALAQRAICFQFHESNVAEYIKLLVMSPSFQKHLVSLATGMTAKGIKASKLKEVVVPIPPLQEQHRIVAKVDEIMTLCDQLKARLIDAQTTKLHLTDAIVEQAL